MTKSRGSHQAPIAVVTTRPMATPRAVLARGPIAAAVRSNEVAVTGITADGAEVPLLRDGVWQV